MAVDEIEKKGWWTGRKHSEETKRKMSISQTGKIKPRREKSHAWRGGRTIHKKGYILLYRPDHPFSVGGYVREHRLVMEEVLGRHLKPDEDVNHINGKKDDNRPENLRVVSHYAHFEEHGCPSCGFKFFTK